MFQLDPHQLSKEVQRALKERDARPQTAPIAAVPIRHYIQANVENKNLAQLLTGKLETPLTTDYLLTARLDWTRTKEDIFASMFNAFEPQEVQGQLVDPKQTIDALFSVAQEMQNMIKYRAETRMQTIAANGTYNPSHFPTQTMHEQWYIAFRSRLEEATTLAAQAAGWAQARAQHNDTAGKQIKKKLAAYGLERNAAQTVQALGKKALTFYDSFETHQLKAYR